MAERLAARLAAQEDQIRLLTKEISALRDGLSNGPTFCADAPVSPELENLRTENEKLRYRLVHLRRSLQAELELEGAKGKRRQGAVSDRSVENSSKEKQTVNRPDKNKVKSWTVNAASVWMLVTPPSWVADPGLLHCQDITPLLKIALCPRVCNSMCVMWLFPLVHRLQPLITNLVRGTRRRRSKKRSKETVVWKRYKTVTLLSYLLVYCIIYIIYKRCIIILYMC